METLSKPDILSNKSAETELDALDELDKFERTVQPEEQLFWPEANSDDTVSEATYLNRLRWHIGQAGHALDTIYTNIKTDEDAERWLQLKERVAELKTNTDPYVDTTTIDKLLQETETFVKNVGFDMDAYNQVANK